MNASTNDPSNVYNMKMINIVTNIDITTVTATVLSSVLRFSAIGIDCVFFKGTHLETSVNIVMKLMYAMRPLGVLASFVI